MTAHPNDSTRVSGAPFLHPPHTPVLSAETASPRPVPLQRELSRRALVGAATLGAAAMVGALVGCAPEPRELTDAASEALPATPESVTAVPEPSPVAAQHPAPDLEAIIAAHEGQVPSAWGVDIPGVVRTGAEAGAADASQVFLTLDACGGPAGSGVDSALLEGLRAAQVPALLFLNLRWITAHPALASELARDPLFTLGNHGSQHLPLSVNGAAAYGIPGTTSVRSVVEEVWHNHVALTELTGAPPKWFRPGTAHLDNVALSIVEALGERTLGFSVNGDAGATFSAATVAAEVGSAPPDAVVIAHFNQPGSGTAAGILAAVQTVREHGLSFGRL